MAGVNVRVARTWSQRHVWGTPHEGNGFGFVSTAGAGTNSASLFSFAKLSAQLVSSAMCGSVTSQHHKQTYLTQQLKLQFVRRGPGANPAVGDRRPPTSPKHGRSPRVLRPQVEHGKTEMAFPHLQGFPRPDQTLDPPLSDTTIPSLFPHSLTCCDEQVNSIY